MRIAVTIDAEHPDRPTRDATGNAVALFDLLRRRGVVGTVFVQGSWALAYPELFETIVDDGHLVGCHSYWHCIFSSLTDDGIADDLRRSREALDTLSPTHRLFRLPGADGANDGRVRAALQRGGYEHVGWTCGGNDWEHGVTPNQVAPPIIDATRSSARPSVALLHSWPDPTPTAVEMLLDDLLGTADFVRLDQLGPTEVPH